jgi:hypothetical protein
MSYLPTKWFKKIIFCVAYVKMIKFSIKISFSVTCFFLQNQQKMFVFHETLHYHIEC